MAKHDYVFGLHAVQTLLKTAPHRVVELRVLKDRKDQRLQKIINAANNANIPIQGLHRSALDKLVDGNHQGVVAIAQPGETYSEHHLQHILDNDNLTPFFLVLDGVTDPHNLGACLRTAEAAGVHAVIAPKDNSASLNAVARKIACGAADIVPYVLVTNLARTLKDLQEAGVWIIGTAGEATTELYDADLKGPIALVMGAEGKGMRRLTREYCDHLVKLTMAGEVSSLNVSVATGIALFEAVRQRREAE
ncbi:23S rRNA (guanosine(2251)-2'-O)-methyltransferase RlmB [Marinibactrum halimedae]|uniref:23S rRNA (guanosine-2'-O-)-methyltransferase RlmB n=1 Tax=Marinibactrum halimedae TaxID=1444977 RepID=A0AA37WNU0_9GAMM|nr:23S rRNA (guanosine(2251)-2'-O)-methyltransferase RlmB [Marinibactrum halimedae]MCD9459892.1 23S rRNA (guanosine(2251)-2'-O)-methyltransferase RlmB [Marinibactrum halimedae]GLS25252.1 23S rRNA (guanosine-2'-O-)-methyltransferase RlmB [Marinibactrum halimedae]